MYNEDDIILSVLDQTIVYNGITAKQAIENTIATAIEVEQLGYKRFWVSEHHNSTFIAGSAPELLMVKIAGETNTIKIGSGGIMLPNHSAYKVAENFRMLETLFPGRIDLGMGRAPGTDRITASLLNPSNTFSEADYLTQLDHLRQFFKDIAATQYGKIIASPVIDTMPNQFLLSSSGGSAAIAAKYGMGLAIAKFINGDVTASIIKSYRNAFVPSAELVLPKELIAIFIVCAETEEKAAEMRKLLDYVQVQLATGNFDNIGNEQAVKKHVFSSAELQIINKNKGKIISGTQLQVKKQVLALANDMDVNEIMISTMAFSQKDRMHSFKLISEAFHLN